MVAIDEGPEGRFRIINVLPAEDPMGAAEKFGQAVERLESGAGHHDPNEDLDPPAGTDMAEDKITEEEIADVFEKLISGEVGRKR